jgi:MFS family permease
METARWIVATAFGALSLFCIVGNPIAGWLACRQGGNYSWMPFVGAIFGAIAIAVCPAIGLSWWMLLPLVLDLTVPMFVFVVVTGRLWSEPHDPGLQADEPPARP